MTRRSIPFAQSVASGCVVFSEPDNSLWMGTEAGEVVTCRLLDGRMTVLGGGYLQPAAVLPMTDGLGVLVVERAGRLLVAHRDSAGEVNSEVVADLARPLAAARLHPDGGLALVVEAGDSARLLRVDLSNGVVEVLAEALEDPAALAVMTPARTAVVLEQTAAGHRLVTVELDTGAVGSSAAIIPADPVALIDAPNAEPGVIVASGAVGELTFLRVDGVAVPPGPENKSFEPPAR